MTWPEPSILYASFSAAALAAVAYMGGRRSFSSSGQSFGHPAEPVSEDQFFVLLDSMVDSALVVDALGTIQYANAAAVALLGAGRAELVGSPAEFRVMCDAASAITSIGTGTALCANGPEIPVEITRTPLPIGQAAGQLLLIRDRRQHVAVERVVREERDILEAIATHCTLDEVIERISAGVARVQTGLRMAALVRRAGVTTCFGGLPPETRRAIESIDAGGTPPESWWTTPRIFDDVQQDPMFVPSLPGLRAAGLRSCWTFPVLPPNGGEALGVLLLFPGDQSRPTAAEIELAERCVRFLHLAVDRELMTEQLATQALLDALTGLPNRMLTSDRVTHAIKRARRSGSQLATMLIDLDGFKVINDSLGNQNGDLLLQQVAERLKTAIRSSDTLGRFGADQFALVASDLAEHSLSAICDRLQAAFKQPFTAGGKQLTLTASIGVSCYPADGDDVNVLLRNADSALTHAKRHSRGSFRMYEPSMHEATVERVETENELRTAIQKNELVVYYQPQVDAFGSVVAVEALVRWKRGGVLIPPLKFISIAEECGLIVPIGTWVLGEACRWCKQWQTAGRRAIRVAVNVSALQFAQDDFVQVVRDRLADANLDPKWLEVEVTESLLMQNTKNVAGKLEKLRAMGVAVAIDDFGTGYSSLAYLQKLPIDILKIDRSFVKDIPSADDQGSEKTAVIRAILSMAHSLQLRVVAEGVETDTHLKFLRRSGCHQMQGYYFSPPKPGEDIPDIVERIDKAAVRVRAA